MQKDRPLQDEAEKRKDWRGEESTRPRPDGHGSKGHELPASEDEDEREKGSGAGPAAVAPPPD